MKKLIILRGLPGSGKSTWIRENNYEIYTLSMDTIRLMFAEPNPTISQQYNQRVFEIFSELLETRLKTGSFTIIDNVNQTWKYIKPYIEIGEKYGYDIEIKQFDVPLEVCLERNKNRETYKQVPEEVVRRMDEQMKNTDNEKIKRFIKSKE